MIKGINIKRKYLVIMVLILLVGVLTTTLSYFGVSLFGTADNSSGVVTGTIDLNITDSAVNVSNLGAIYSKYYRTQAYKKTFSFNTDDSEMNGCVSIYLDISSISNGLKSTNFRYRLESSDGEYIRVGNFSEAEADEDFYIYRGIFLEPDTDVTFDLYLWISYDENTDQNSMLNTTFSAKVSGKMSDSENENVCYASIADYENDIDIISMFINNEEATELNSNKFYVLDNASCTNGEDVTYDSFTKTVTITPLTSKTKCSLYFVESNGWYNACGNSSNKLNCKMLSNNVYGAPKADTNVVFDTTSSLSGDVGLYYTTKTNLTEDSDGDGVGDRVYYYRGATENNYVIFANYCWRIIRTNENGSIRLRYGGTPSTSNGVTTCPQTGQDVYTHQGASAIFNSSYNDNRYVGYMYGDTCDTYENCHKNENPSNIKTTLETWYNTNLNSYTSSYVEDAVYCNDRQIAEGDTFTNLTNTKKGFASNITYYKSADRLMATGVNYFGAPSNAQPTYKCERNDDKFSLSNATGNGMNNKPIGLITADEIAFAGGEWYNIDSSSNNSSYYLNTGQYYWTMTPKSFYTSKAAVYRLIAAGHLGGADVSYIDARILPVISLKNTVTVLNGTGAYNSPYRIN